MLRRASQMIVVNCNKLSNFATAIFIQTESRENLARAILVVVTPLRNSARVEGRTDRAMALKFLRERPDRLLRENNINLVLGDHGNVN